MNIIEYCITDLRSLRAVIKAKLKNDPCTWYVEVSYDLWQKLLKELDYANEPITKVYGPDGQARVDGVEIHLINAVPKYPRARTVIGGGG